MKLRYKSWKAILVGDLTVHRLFRSIILIYIFLIAYVYLVSDSMMFVPHPPFYKDNRDIIKRFKNPSQN